MDIKNGTIVKTQNGGNTSMESKISYFHFQNNKLKAEKIQTKTRTGGTENSAMFIQSFRCYFLHEFRFFSVMNGIVIQISDEGLCLNEE